MVQHRHLDEMTPWNDRLHMLEVVGVVDEAPAVKTFIFRSPDGCWFRYKPGQFVTLELPVGDGEPLFRTYTLASSPSRPYCVAVTVKAQEGSVGTRWMFDHLRPGMRIKAYGPNGHFTHVDHPAGRYLFISAGSGITPMMAMLRWMADLAPQSDVAFVSCARSPRDIIFRHELELLDRQMPNLSLSVMVKGNSLGESWFGHRGQISHPMLAMLVPDLMEREVFCCGPEAFMALVQDFLRDAGFDMAHYHQESFGEAAADAPAEQVAIVTEAGAEAGAASDGAIPVVFANWGVTGSCQPGQTVLEAARAAGVRIPAACESGICGTCKTRKISGEVVMTHNGGILDEEVEEGYILACCSRPLGPLELDA
jgi:ferredoxin-NADP reductase